MSHHLCCQCTPCRGERNAQQQAIGDLKAEGRWFTPGEVISSGNRRIDIIGQQDAMFLNIFAIREKRRTVH